MNENFEKNADHDQNVGLMRFFDDDLSDTDNEFEGFQMEEWELDNFISCIPQQFTAVGDHTMFLCYILQKQCLNTSLNCFGIRGCGIIYSHRQSDRQN